MTVKSGILVRFHLLSSLSLVMASYIPPKIIRDDFSTEDPIVQVGDNFTIACEGSEDLHWVFPQSRSTANWTTFMTDSEITENGVYKSYLSVINISYPFVGYYSCHYNTSDDMDRIYFFVNDTEHLSVEDSYTLHYAVQYQETTIPCRPTMPDVNVTLISYGTDDVKHHFDPKTGFTFNVSNIGFQDTYSCCFTGPNFKTYFELTFFLEIVEKTARSFLAIPYIEDNSNNHTDAGEPLKLNCWLRESSYYVEFVWITPRGRFRTIGQNANGVHVGRPKHNDSLIHSPLTITRSSVEDTGIYSCIVMDRQNNSANTESYIVVHDTDKCYNIELKEENKHHKVSVDANEQVQWVVDFLAHPIPELIWYDNKGNEVKNNSMFHTKMKSNQAIFEIEHALLDHNGVYKLKIISKRGNKHRSCPKTAEARLTLTVTDKPTVCFVKQDGNCRPTKNAPPNIYLVNNSERVECRAQGNPIPFIAWQEKVEKESAWEYIQISDYNEQSQEPFINTSYLHINTTRDGLVKCIANNSLGRSEVTLPYYISDVADGFDLSDFGVGSVVTKNSSNLLEMAVALNEILRFSCGVSPRRSEDLELFFNDKKVNNGNSTTVVKSNWSTRITVTVRNARREHSGVYSCRIRNIHDKSVEYRNISIIVSEAQPPMITNTNLNGEVVIDYPKKQKALVCESSGLPRPSIVWYKGNNIIGPTNRIWFDNDGTTLFFNYTELTDEGVYKCEASNRLGSTSKEAPLKFTGVGVKPISLAIYYITGIITVLLLGAMTYIFWKHRKEQALRRQLKLLGLENFHNGNPENLNPELGIDDQAELLPYNKNFEFPIERLQIGKQLGSGAFGVVMRAEAKSIIPGEPMTTVAVKMVKKNADQSYIKALASELKIMVHLGQHINVVNLLGACTKNVAKSELLVIVEFCRFGNLQNYIYKHRETYVDQVNPATGHVDYYIGADILERSYSVSSDNCSSPVPSYSIDSKGRHPTMTTQVSTTGDESVIMSNNSAQPQWRVNYRGDYRGDVKPISTRDLLTWSFQVARGMEYLASRKVLHGDLAARNILLADNNVVKICDFGLAKTMYNDDNYKKKSNNPLPIKWMAIESIRDRVFSTQSDVWSFGIVLWEFFSLAKIPYPGMDADERLYQKLVEGYRMEIPTYAPKEVYEIMLECWHTKPLSRPSFTKLADNIGALLEDSVRKHYVDLNDPYLKMNTEKLEDNDYLAMLSPPSFEVLSTPTSYYANVDSFPMQQLRANNTESHVPKGYCFMGGNNIFSPRKVDSDGVFDFQAGTYKSSDTYLGLSEPDDDDLEKVTGYLTPITPVNSISNPLYHQLPDKPKTNDILLTTLPDNYISMPQYKNLLNSTFKDNSLVRLGKSGGRAHYVNGDVTNSHC